MIDKEWLPVDVPACREPRTNGNPRPLCGTRNAVSQNRRIDRKGAVVGNHGGWKKRKHINVETKWTFEMMTMRMEIVLKT